MQRFAPAAHSPAQFPRLHAYGQEAPASCQRPVMSHSSGCRPLHCVEPDEHSLASTPAPSAPPSKAARPSAEPDAASPPVRDVASPPAPPPFAAASPWLAVVASSDASEAPRSRSCGVLPKIELHPTLAAAARATRSPIAAKSAERAGPKAFSGAATTREGRMGVCHSYPVIFSAQGSSCHPNERRRCRLSSIWATAFPIRQKPRGFPRATARRRLRSQIKFLCPECPRTPDRTLRPPPPRQRAWAGQAPLSAGAGPARRRRESRG